MILLKNSYPLIKETATRPAKKVDINLCTQYPSSKQMEIVIDSLNGQF